MPQDATGYTFLFITLEAPAIALRLYIAIERAFAACLHTPLLRIRASRHAFHFRFFTLRHSLHYADVDFSPAIFFAYFRQLQELILLRRQPLAMPPRHATPPMPLPAAVEMLPFYAA